MPGAIDATLRKFHASMNVSDLTRSIAFYRTLLGVEPAKVRPDYAKFDLAEPPLVLSLVPGRPSGMGHLNHAGLRLRTAEELVEIQHRLEAAGMPTTREEGVECCYARQTKFWINDPDGALWEIYVFHEDIAEHGHGAPPPRMTAAANTSSAAAVRQATHRLGQPAVELGDDGALDEVHLQGSLNGGDAMLRNAVLVSAQKALRPGGTLHLRGLSGDQECPYVTLTGAAAGVRYAPTSAMLVDAIRAAGFVDVTIDHLGQKPCFHADGVALREIRVSARKVGNRAAAVGHRAVYLGPMSQVADDFGNVFTRGVATRLNEHDWQLLRQGPAAASFVFLEPEHATASEPSSCCSSEPAPSALR